MQYKDLKTSIAVMLGVLSLSSCKNLVSGDNFIISPDGKKYLYVASGSCYGGGVATNTGVGVISKYDLETGARVGTVINYFAQSPNDQPVGLIEYNGDLLMSLVENTAGRRMDLIYKNGNGISIFSQNATILAAQLRGISKSADGGFYIARSSAVEKISGSKQRITSGAAAYINAPAAPCATSTTVMTQAIELPSGKILYSHAAVSPNNRIGLISSSGYNIAGDCLAGTAGPTTTALPTALAYYGSAEHTLVAYGSTTASSNFIYSYNVNETANTIGSATRAYYNPSFLSGPSAMTVDSTNGYVYVANATLGAESIERFTYDTGTRQLTRVGSSPFIPLDVYVRCVSGMLVASE
ncbi:MAG: hypothetical protein JST80_12820 [Bdellovibrionales bacterium]|nr:hypothetical protein [Bdellovibrionales bacterium]